MTLAANGANLERRTLLRKLRNQDISFGEVLRKPPKCIAGVPTIRVLELAYFRRPAPKCLVLLNEEAAKVGLNAYLPIAALPLRGRDFFENWTCNHIVPMLQSRLRQQTTTQEGKMAQVIDQLPTRTRAGRTAKYPYNDWLDGRVWQLEQGEDKDFTGEVDSFTQGLRQAGNSRGMFVSAVKVEGGVAIQARPLTDEDRARRAAITEKRAATKAAAEKNGKAKAKAAA